MTMFKSVMSGLALASATALLSVSAFADGPSALRPWTGFYVGVNAGWAWGDADLRSKFGCPDDFCAYVNPDNLGLVGGLGTGSFNADGFTGGVQAGYNWQQGKVVLGYEVDFNAFDLGGSQFGVGSFPAGLDPNHAAGVGTSISADWLFTFRGRLGYAVSPTVLAYVTGGFALTELRLANAYLDNAGDFGGITAAGESGTSKMRTGWTLGGGVEWALNGNWSIKGEYLYVDFGSVSTTAGVVAVDATPNALSTSGDLTTHIGRLGINYKF